MTQLSWPFSVAPGKFSKIPPLISQLLRYRGPPQLPRTNFLKYYNLLANSQDIVAFLSCPGTKFLKYHNLLANSQDIVAFLSCPGQIS